MFKDVNNVTLDLTEGCNLKCDYCFTYSEHERKSIDKDLAKLIIDDLITSSEANHLNITYFGGEPLLEWELLKELTTYAIARGKMHNKIMRFDMTTNGTLLTEEKIKWLKEHNIMILVSYDGIKESHDLSRKYCSGKSSWETIRDNILMMKRNNFDTKVRLTLSRKNCKYLFENVKHIFEDFDLNFLIFSPVFEDEWTEDDLSVLRDQFDKISEYIIECNKNKKYYLIKHLHAYIEFLIKSVCQHTDIDYPCGAGRGFLGISYDGVVFPCHRFNKHGLTFEERIKLPHVYGAYIDKKFIEINNSDIQKQIRNYTSDEMYPDKCKKCKLLNCNGNCIAANYDMNKDVLKPLNFSCIYQGIMANAATKLLIYYIQNGLSFENIGSKNEKSLMTTTCGCYMATYVDDVHHGLLPKFLDLSKRILQSKNEEKTEEQKQLETDVLEKTIHLLKDANTCPA